MLLFALLLWAAAAARTAEIYVRSGSCDGPAVGTFDIVLGRCYAAPAACDEGATCCVGAGLEACVDCTGCEARASFHVAGGELRVWPASPTCDGRSFRMGHPCANGVFGLMGARVLDARNATRASAEDAVPAPEPLEREPRPPVAYGV